MATIDEEINSTFPNDRVRFVVNLMYTSGWIRNMSNELLKPFDISMQQYNILRILRGAGEWRAMNDVKGRMVEKAPNATRLADKLVAKGLIERRRCDLDRRVVYVHIADQGLELLTQIDKIDRGEFLNNITDEDARLASDLLDRLRG